MPRSISYRRTCEFGFRRLRRRCARKPPRPPTPRSSRRSGRLSNRCERVASRPVKVTITYCAECGYEPMTLDLARALMNQFGHQLSSIELIPWYEGSFDVSVGGE